MKIYALLPLSRFEQGQLWVEDAEGQRIFGPVRCRGEADNLNAAKANNVIEDPTRVGGDHPFGLSRVVRVIRNPKPEASYGPAFIALNPVGGQAWESRLAGRTGIGVHGGRLHEDGRLRETYGCNRLDNDHVETLADLVEAELAAGRDIFYECGQAFSA